MSDDHIGGIFKKGHPRQSDQPQEDNVSPKVERLREGLRSFLLDARHRGNGAYADLVEEALAQVEQAPDWEKKYDAARREYEIELEMRLEAEAQVEELSEYALLGQTIQGLREQVEQVTRERDGYLRRVDEVVVRAQREEVRRIEAEAQVEPGAREANKYRIEADEAMRDYDALELRAGEYEGALKKIEEGRPNKPFDPWARMVAANALSPPLSRLAEKNDEPRQFTDLTTGYSHFGTRKENTVD